LNRNLEDIRLEVEEQGRLLNCLTKSGAPVDFPHCFSVCAGERRLKEMLLEAIQVLEESRKAFKPRRLEALRKKLIQALSETV
jgi:hypothetical protein